MILPANCRTRAGKVLPAVTKPKPELVAARTPAGLVLTNNGNTNTLVYDGEACPPAPSGGAKPECAKIAAHRMYAGSSWTVPLPHPGDPVTFQVQMGEANDPETVKY